jgi:hypothetical protein
LSKAPRASSTAEGVRGLGMLQPSYGLKV